MELRLALALATAVIRGRLGWDQGGPAVFVLPIGGLWMTTVGCLHPLPKHV